MKPIIVPKIHPLYNKAGYDFLVGLERGIGGVDFGPLDFHG